MYPTQKPFRDENYKPKKSHKNTPSFSSTLLDEIYRSIDGNDDGLTAKNNTIGDEETARLTRACLVDEWMKKEKAVSKTRTPSLLPELENTSFQDNDFMFFSSNSSSSDSSGALSSSDTEFFGSRTKISKSKVSCFSTKPKPVRTGRLGDDKKNTIVDDDFATNKSRALNFYANLKKVKQPISPGAKLTNFINSFFSNNYKSKNGKKSRPNPDTNKGFDCLDRDSKTSSLSSSCSSASSFSRSCLIQNSSRSRDGIQRTVRFHLGDEDCDQRYSGKPPLPPNAKIVLKGYQNSQFWKIRNEDEDEEEDAVSDSSSDLFELDNLSLFENNNNRFCEELPVYETTYFDKNCSLIR